MVTETVILQNTTVPQNNTSYRKIIFVSNMLVTTENNLFEGQYDV